MAGINERIVTVFGGTGFLGRRVVRHLRSHEVSVRIASRHPDRGRELFARDDPHRGRSRSDIHDERAVTDALVGAYGGGERCQPLCRARAGELSLRAC